MGLSLRGTVPTLSQVTLLAHDPSHPLCAPQGKCEKRVQDVIERFWDFIDQLSINTFGGSWALWAGWLWLVGGNLGRDGQLSHAPHTAALDLAGEESDKNKPKKLQMYASVIYRT